MADLPAEAAGRAARAEALLRHVEDLVGRVPALRNLYGRWLGE